MKTSYKNSVNKKRIREFLISRFYFENVIGLAGPNISEYINFLQSKGCKHFEIYENNPEMVVRQLSTIGPMKSDVSLIYDDILIAEPNKPKTLYDLDFCVTVRHMEKYIAKFRDSFIMTFSLRGITVKETIKFFLNTRNEELISEELFATHSVFTTNQSKYLFTRYHDTSTMCCFAKI